MRSGCGGEWVTRHTPGSSRLFAYQIEHLLWLFCFPNITAKLVTNFRLAVKLEIKFLYVGK